MWQSKTTKCTSYGKAGGARENKRTGSTDPNTSLCDVWVPGFRGTCYLIAVTSSFSPPPTPQFTPLLFTIGPSGLGLLSKAILALCEPARYLGPSYLIFSIARSFASWLLHHKELLPLSPKSQKRPTSEHHSWDHAAHFCDLSTVPFSGPRRHTCTCITYRVREVANYWKGDSPDVITATGRGRTLRQETPLN